MDNILVHKYFFRATLLLLIIFTAAISHLGYRTHLADQKKNIQNIAQTSSQQKTNTESSEGQVLGANYRTPQIFVTGGDSSYAAGGMIALASTDEPAIYIGGYDISGEADINIYKANESALIDYLLHDKDGKQIKAQPDITSFEFIGNVKQNIQSNTYDGTKVMLPLEGTGIWHLHINVGSREVNAFVLRSNVGVFAKEGKNEIIFWGQNFKNKRSISGGLLKILNLQDSMSELQSVSFEDDGTAKTNLNSKADIALYSQDGDISIVPINLKYLNTGYSYQYFVEQKKRSKYFIFTDRPLYKPGDTINFKAIVRDDDDARYSVSKGSITAKIYNQEDYYAENKSTPLYEKSLPLSSNGTINGSAKLPDDAKAGYYQLALENPTDDKTENYYYDGGSYSPSTQSFMVEYYRKPESFLELSLPENDIIAGNKISFKIKGSYFSGQPLLNQKVNYVVNAGDFYEYQYLNDLKFYSDNLSNDFRYYFSYGKEVIRGTADLDKDGFAEIEIPTKMDFNDGKSQIFTIEATLSDGSQNPAYDRKNLLVYSGEYGIYRTDSSYGAKVNTKLELPVVLKPNKDSKASLSQIPLAAKIKRSYWETFQEKDKKYPTYKSKEENLPDIAARTNDNGEAVFSLTPKDTGSYEITATGRDNHDNVITKKFYSYVTKDGEAAYSEAGGDDITVTSDKQKYNPNDTAKLNIFSKIPNRDVFLTLERGRVDRYQVVHMNGKNASVNIPLINTDIPNMFAQVSSFSNSYLETNQANLIVSSLSKKVKVAIKPDSKTYGPGSTVKVNINTTDGNGKPVSAEVALWAVDKAIFELTENNLGNIFDTFWQERYDSTVEANSLEGISVQMAEGGGGCFASDTMISMADGSKKQIKDVKKGDMILTRSEKDNNLVKAHVVDTQKAEDPGYLIINDSLKITPDHILRVNNTWLEAGSIQIGDNLTNQQGKNTPVTSIEWQVGKFTVYNLEIEKYHTFIANNVWVHNQKGDARTVFKDTAYWNPSIQTDLLGNAQVTFTLPDNLTTWTLASVASTTDTKVGQTTEEIVVGKDITIRPILPNLLRIGDEAVLSAVLQNFSDKDQTFDVGLTFDAGDIEKMPSKSVTVKSHSQEELKWKVKATKENPKSQLVFSAKSTIDPKRNDIVTLSLPIRPFGFSDKRAETGVGNKTFKVAFDKNSSKSKSDIKLYVASSMVGTLPSAMDYLIDYPYGCVEQTTSRFVPAVIAKNNSAIFGQTLKDRDVDAVIKKGVNRLSTLRIGDGGWSWWTNDESNPFVTAYVVEYLLEAQKAGAQVEPIMLESAKGYLLNEKKYDVKKQQEVFYDVDDIIAKNYALTLLGEKTIKMQDTYYAADQNPDLLAMLVITKYLNGDTNPESNGLNKLMSIAQTQGDALFWKAGNKVRFGSIEGSTAMAIRAILIAHGDREAAVKAARYLTRTRQYNYWGNTFATSQVIRALTELAKTNDELAPNYSFTVAVDGKTIKQGSVNSAKQLIDPVKISSDFIQQSGSNVSVTQSGKGQLYSTLVVDEFHQDRNAKAVDHGMNISRKYISSNGSDSSISVGDTVTVELTLSGLKADEHYGVITDELPAGLVPINETFDNEQYGNTAVSRYYSSYDISDKEYTENGVVLSLYNVAPGTKSFTYKARAVSEGTFIAPPATTSLMYAPEIYGRSKVQIVHIGKQSKIFSLPTENKQTFIIFGGAGVLILLLLIAIKKLKKTKGPESVAPSVVTVPQQTQQPTMTPPPAQQSQQAQTATPQSPQSPHV